MILKIGSSSNKTTLYVFQWVTLLDPLIIWDLPCLNYRYWIPSGALFSSFLCSLDNKFVSRHCRLRAPWEHSIQPVAWKDIDNESLIPYWEKDISNESLIPFIFRKKYWHWGLNSVFEKRYLQWELDSIIGKKYWKLAWFHIYYDIDISNERLFCKLETTSAMLAQLHRFLTLTISSSRLTWSI